MSSQPSGDFRGWVPDDSGARYTLQIDGKNNVPFSLRIARVVGANATDGGVFTGLVLGDSARATVAFAPGVPIFLKIDYDGDEIIDRIIPAIAPGAEFVDLAARLEAHPDPVSVEGGLITYTATVENQGEQRSRSGSSFPSVDHPTRTGGQHPPAGCTFEGDATMRCSVPQGLAANEAWAVAVFVIPRLTGQITASAAVASQEQDSNLANNQVHQVTTVVPDRLPARPQDPPDLTAGRLFVVTHDSAGQCTVSEAPEGVNKDLRTVVLVHGLQPEGYLKQALRRRLEPLDRHGPRPGRLPRGECPLD